MERGIKNKVCNITVPNASYNDVTTYLLKVSIIKIGFHLGVLFHVIYCTYIINLLGKDGLSAIEDVIFKVSVNVKYLTRS